VLARSSIALVLLAVLAVSLTAVVLLRRLADEQAEARVALAARAAQDAAARFEAATETNARQLANRPTLARFALTGERAALERFLAEFCEISGHDRCAVFHDATLFAAFPADLASAAVDLDRSGLILGRDGVTQATAVVPVPGMPDTRVYVSRALDDPFLTEMSAHLGMDVELEAVPAHAGGPALSVAVRSGGGYRAAVPLTPAEEASVAVLHVVLPARSVDASVRTLLAILLVATAAAVALAGAGGVWIGRRAAHPLHELAAAARRIGAGDLATPVPAATGEETGRLAATMDDMRRRLRSLTAELRQREAEAQALLGGIEDGVFAVDEERRIRYLNPQLAGLLGIRPEDAVGSFCGDVLRPVLLNGERPCDGPCPIVRARSRGGTRASETLRLADGRTRTVVITSAPPSNRQQVQILRDETQVEGARRVRDAIVANVSHEFRTPLAAQVASLELLRGALADQTDPALLDLVQSTERSSLRLMQLVDNLLESVRLESGQDTIHRRPVLIEDVIEEAVELMAPLLRQRGQRIELDLPARLPHVLGDAQRLTQVLVNLIGNASKFSPEGSRVGIAAAARNGGVRIDVSDEGPGIPPGSEGPIFERFRRASSDTEAGGMGLGLWIVRSVVERHGGSVEARSLQEGGAVFTMSLPSAEGS
jgi:signal transduction histidine kinase